MSYINFTTIGLTLDIIGVILLFKHALPSAVTQYTPSLMIRDLTPKEERKIVRSYYLSYTSIVLIILGFAFQILGNIISSC